jgi:hypothetical protein
MLRKKYPQFAQQQNNVYMQQVPSIRLGLCFSLSTAELLMVNVTCRMRKNAGRSWCTHFLKLLHQKEGNLWSFDLTLPSIHL